MKSRQSADLSRCVMLRCRGMVPEALPAATEFTEDGTLDRSVPDAPLLLLFAFSFCYSTRQDSNNHRKPVVAHEGEGSHASDHQRREEEQNSLDVQLLLPHVQN